MTHPTAEAIAPGPKSRLRDRLLPRTLDHAREIPYYRELWAGLDGRDLAGLPVIGKAGPAGGAAAVRHPGLAPAVLLHSSGTTGTPFVRYRSQEEIAAFGELLQRLSDGARQRLGDERPIVHFTTISKRHHGSVLNVVAVDRTVTLSLMNDRDLAKAVALLGRPEFFPGLKDPVVQFSGSPDDLVILAHALAGAGLNETLAPRTVTAVADYLSELQRAFLAEVFPTARVVERYTMSEVAGGATRCPNCRLLHFDAHVRPEVVSLDDDRPLTEGVGRMVFTELYPFSQYQPLVRYDTGDLVEAVPGGADSCEPGELSAAMVGRRAQTPLVPHRGRTVPVFRPIPLREALESLPAVARAPMYGGMRVYDSIHGSAPLCRPRFVPGTPGRLELTVVTAFAPHLYPDHTETVRKDLTAAVLAACPELAELVRDGAVELALDLTGDHGAAEPFAVRGY
ncbi:hypothetical protein OK074_6592 [Actinobacteria bacterium OK074]|nr:hypothetical protein OK074_6592 [Actinobacteria bacterium OK074]